MTAHTKHTTPQANDIPAEIAVMQITAPWKATYRVITKQELEEELRHQTEQLEMAL